MRKEFKLYPPDIGSIVTLGCGCVTWTSRGAFLIAACAGDCPNMLAMTKIARDSSNPVEFRTGWTEADEREHES